MGRQTKQENVARNKKKTIKILHQKDLRCIAQSKLKKKKCPFNTTCEVKANISKITQEQNLTCFICLQLLLKPVLGACGHSFCLGCAEQLAKNNYCCGICKEFEVRMDLPFSNSIEELVKCYLEKSTPEQKESYAKRLHKFQEKQSIRKLKTVQKGKNVDYWNDEQKVWKLGVIYDIHNQTILQIADLHKYGNYKTTILPIDTRLVAEPYTFTSKNQIIPLQISNLERQNAFMPNMMNRFSPTQLAFRPPFLSPANIIMNSGQNIEFGRPIIHQSPFISFFNIFDSSYFLPMQNARLENTQNRETNGPNILDLQQMEQI